MTLLERVAYLFRIRTLYHVSWVRENGTATQVGNGTWKVRPWLTADRYDELRSAVANSAGVPKDEVLFISVNRL